MTDYTKTTDFTSKDSLPSGDSGKIIRGAEFGTEFDNIETAVNSKSNINNPAFTGNITVTGTVDGRDIAADGTKLDTIETSADVTDTANVTAAGALMDSEVTNLDQVKAFDSSDYATAAQGTTADNALPKTGGAMTGAITTNSTFDGRDVATDGTKLDGIEASADVTDTANVTAAGALMDSELTSEASVKALNQGVATTDSPTFAGVTANGTVEFDGLSGTGAVTVTDILDQDDMSGNSATALATQQSIKAYVDSQVGTVDTLAEVLSNGNATGGTDIAFGDGDKALFGAGSDLQIYHDGLHSYVSDVGTGHLRLTGTNVLVEDGAGTDYIYCASDVVNLYHGGNLKFKTTSTGIDVTGTATMDGLTVDGSSTLDDIILTAVALPAAGNPSIALRNTDNNIYIQSGSGNSITFLDSAQNTMLNATPTSHSLQISNGNAFSINSGRDISFYEDTGTTAKLVWSAANESLTLTGGGLLMDVTAATVPIDIDTNISSTEGSVDILKAKTINNYYSGIALVREGSTNTGLAFKTTDSGTYDTRMSIDSSGNVGIGTTLCGAPLSFADSAALKIQFNGSAANYYGISKLAASGGGDGNLTFTAGQNAAGNFTFNSGGSERMRIDANGDVGIGTSDPTSDLQIKASSAKFRLTDSGITNTSHNTFNVFAAGQNKFALGVSSETGTSADITIDGATNNIGIGTSSPSSPLHISNSGNSVQLRMQRDASNYWGFQLTGGALNFQDIGNSTTPLSIDSIGNLLVGKSSADDFSSAGAQIEAGGQFTNSVASAPSLRLNRGGNDGVIIELNKAGAPVGSIRSQSGLVTDIILDPRSNNYSTGHGIGGTQVSGVPKIIPRDGSGNALDGGVDLGHSNNRFKDLYLSGDVNLANNSQITFASTSCNIEGNSSGADFIKFTTANSEAVRIDVSGNLLVSKSSTSIGTVGVEAKADGQLWATRDGNPVLSLNRKTSDGSIAAFYKDGAPVGSIGARGGDVYLETGNTGIRMYDASNAIIPVGSTGVSRDAAIDLGLGPNLRFKDLYLSGGVVFGATGGNVSSKTLDDYEEGTWTPAALNYDGTMTVDSATYEKIGRQVTLRAVLSFDGTSDGSSLLLSIPFNHLSTAEGSTGSVWGGGNINVLYKNSSGRINGRKYDGSSVTYTSLANSTIEFTYIYATA